MPDFSREDDNFVLTGMTKILIKKELKEFFYLLFQAPSWRPHDQNLD